MTVAPRTAALAAAWAFWRLVPVRRVSSGPWVIWAGLPAAPAGGAPGVPEVGAADPEDGADVPDDPEGLLDVEPVAAAAMPAAPRLAPATRAPVTNVLRAIDRRGVMMLILSSLRIRDHPGR